MKNVLLAFLTLVLVTGAFGQNGNFHLDEEYDVKSNGTIDLISSDANVFITGSARKTAHVKIDRNVVTGGFNSSKEEFRVDVAVVDGNLRIREHQKSLTIGFIAYQREDYKIEIEAPEGASLVIRGDDGDYFIKNVNGKISMSLDDADVELTDCKGDAFTFRIDDGKIRMRGGRGMLDIDGDDSDVEVYEGAFSSISTTLDDGDLVLETALDDGGNYFLRSEDGSISLRILAGGGEFHIDHDDGSVLLQGDFQTLSESDDYTRVLLARGKAKVRLRADDARVKLISETR